MNSRQTHEAVADLVELLKFPTVSHTGHLGPYKDCCNFLVRKCQEAGLATKQVEFVQGKPIVIASWQGKNRDLPSLLLTGHYDVVPCDESKWTKDPFGAQIEDQKIYARGAQDMKCVVMAYIESVKRLKQSSWCPLRSIHLTFVPDEEIGGKDGMMAFINSSHFKELNVGFALDEGLCSPDGTIPVYFGERAIWWIMVTASGRTGHSSTFHEQSAMKTVLEFCSKAMEFRDKENSKFLNKQQKLGDTTTLNINALKAGHTVDGVNYALNVVPSNVTCGIDIRIPPTLDLKQFEAQTLKRWQQECEHPDTKLTYELVNGSYDNPMTDLTNSWWKQFHKQCLELDLVIEPRIFPAATDSRFLRQKGIPCLGFTPIPNTLVKFHDHDEFIGIEEYLKSLSIYEHLVKSLAG